MAEPWSARFGDPQWQAGTWIDLDPEGNLVVAGLFTGSIDVGSGPIFSAGGDDTFVAKLDPDGGLLWARQLGGSGSDQVYSGAMDAEGNIVLGGRFSGTIDLGGGPVTSTSGADPFVVKLSPDGGHLWSRVFPDAAWSEAPSVAVAGSGDVLVTGAFEGSIDLGGGPLTSAGGFDVFLARYSAEGTHLWSRRSGGVSQDMPTAIAAAPGDDVIVAGRFMSPSIDLGGGPLVSAGGMDFFLVRLAPDGSHVWSRRYGDAEHQGHARVAVSAGGLIALAGTMSGSLDLGGGAISGSGFVARLNGDGSHGWSSAFGSSQGWPEFFGVDIDADGAVLITGRFDGVVEIGAHELVSDGRSSDVLAAKFNAEGVATWAAAFGDSEHDGAGSVAAGSRGVALTGQFWGSIDFGDRLLTSAGGSDVFVATFRIDDVAPTVAITSPDPSVATTQPFARGAIEGVASDGLAGVASVLVTFSSPLGTSTQEALLTCDDRRLSCSWSAAVPDLPGVYVVQALAFDDAANEAVSGTITLVVV